MLSVNETFIVERITIVSAEDRFNICFFYSDLLHHEVMQNQTPPRVQLEECRCRGLQFRREGGLRKSFRVRLESFQCRHL
jgi:hypothetical protein